MQRDILYPEEIKNNHILKISKKRETITEKIISISQRCENLSRRAAVICEAATVIFSDIEKQAKGLFWK